MAEKTYLAIDLKSFYASVECVERSLDPLDALLVVADRERSEKTICLAVSPALKAYGIPGRPRLFQVVSAVEKLNARRRSRAPEHKFRDTSRSRAELEAHPDLELSYVVARPQMAHYIDVSTRIYEIYLKYVAPEDIHVYSIDEVFMDVTNYLGLYRMSAHDLAMTIILDVLKTTGITATAGIGPNLYLSKIAMDIEAKHLEADENGVRIAELDQRSYRENLWDHQPLTDFWRVGPGYAKKLASVGIHTMGEVARCSIGEDGEFYNEDLLYRLFGKNAELLIDHAWGIEPTEISDIKAYRPENTSLGAGQVLRHPYTYEKAKNVVREMAESLALDLTKKGLVTDQITLTVGYDSVSLQGESPYTGEVSEDRYGRTIPKHAHGTEHLIRPGSSMQAVSGAAFRIFERTVDPKLMIRRMYLSAEHTKTLQEFENAGEQLSFLDQIASPEPVQEDSREEKMQEAILSIREKFGKNAVFKGADLQEDATALERGAQIGGHRA